MASRDFFFQRCWEVVSSDVLEATVAFFQGVRLPKVVTSTLLVLVLKTPNASSFGEFRPLTMCNFLNKIFSKVCTRRMVEILPKIISKEYGEGLRSGGLGSDDMGLPGAWVCGRVDRYYLEGGVELLVFSDDQWCRFWILQRLAWS